MATCKKCIHFKVCEIWREEECQCARSYSENQNGICGCFKDQSLFMALPCAPGTHLWRVTYPYRQEPKVTEYVVKNFRTIGKKHQLQIEVQAVNVPGTNWMKFQDFYTNRVAAENELAKIKEGNHGTM